MTERFVELTVWSNTEAALTKQLLFDDQMIVWMELPADATKLTARCVFPPDPPTPAEVDADQLADYKRMVELLREGWTVGPSEAYDEEGVECWVWSSPDGVERFELGLHEDGPVIPAALRKPDNPRAGEE